MTAWRSTSYLALLAIIGGAGALAWVAGLWSSQNTASSSHGRVQLVVDYGTAANRPRFEATVANFRGTGWQLLQKAGLSVQGTDEYPQSFVCRINDWPAAEVQNCRDTPTYAEGSWKYFIADQKLGNNWLASGFGAAAHQTGCGMAEAWLWVDPSQASSSKDSAVPGIAPRFYPCER